MSVARGEWDTYWKQQQTVTRTYGRIADIYRKFIIPKSLTRTIRSTVSSGSHLLHAGAGAGAVEIRLPNEWTIHSIDYSKQAVTEHQSLYKSDGRHSLALQGDIFALPYASGTFDAVFNLGVMEHFSDEEILAALKEMGRVLRVDGHVILYWPPVWGLSVFALRLVKSVLRLTSRKRIVLHPPEINLLESRHKCEQWLKSTGFVLERFSFGVGDFFTHQIVVARRTNE